MVYPIFIFFLKFFLRKNFKEKANLKILEIGSGSGGLAREILKNLKDQYSIDYYLFDMDVEILNWAQQLCQEKGCNVFYIHADSDYLKKIKDNEFDVIISLHTIHHIHPSKEVELFFKEVARCSKHGFFIADFHRKFGNILILRLACFFINLSKDLIDDGVKSLNRSYLKSDLIRMSNIGSFKVKTTSFFWNPYLIIEGIRSSK